MAATEVDDKTIIDQITKMFLHEEELSFADAQSASEVDAGEDSACPASPHERFMALWSARFEAVGVKLPDALAALGVEEADAEAAEESLQTLALLLEKAPICDEQLSMLTDVQLSKVAQLCLKTGVVNAAAAAEIRNLAKNMSADGRMRLRYALALCRVPDEGNQHAVFDEGRYEAALAGLPPCYREDFADAASAVRRCVEAGQRVSVLLNAPSGAPVESFAQALASCISRGPLPAVSIDAGSFSSAIDLMGCTAAFSQAAPGLVARSLLEGGDRCLIVRHAESLSKLKKSDGDPVLFLATLARRGTFRDAYLGIQANMPAPLIVVCDSASRDNSFASCCAVSATVHALSRNEKIAEARRQLDDAEVAYASDVPECVVDGYCFGAGTEAVTNCCRLLAAFDVQREGGGALGVQDVAQALPAPNANDPCVWYGLKRAKLPPDVDGLALALLESALDEANPACEQSRRRLKVLLDAVPDGTRLPARTAAEVADAIALTHPLLGGIERIAKAVAASLHGAHPRPLMLVGPAGTGKTTLCESLSAALGGVPFAKRDFPGLSASEVFGTRSAPGLLTEAAAAHCGAPGVLLIDEVDKPSCCDPTSLLSLLDEGRIADSFLNAPADLSRWLVVLTANDLDKVSPYLVDRCAVVNVLGYTSEAKVAIAKAALVKRLGKKLGFANVEVSDAALRYVAQLDDAAGMRGFEKRLEQLIANEGACGCVDERQARELFALRVAATSGVRVVMARGGSAGGAALACVGAVAGEGNFGVSCLSEVPAVERNVKLTQVALAQLRILPKAVHLFLAEADDLQSCHCPDAMLGFGIALALADAGMPVDFERTAFIGAVRPSGELVLDSPDALEKASFIIARAVAYGCDTLVCPASFAAALEVKQAAEHAQVELIGMDCLAQAIEFAKDTMQLRDLVMTL